MDLMFYLRETVNQQVKYLVCHRVLDVMDNNGVERWVEIVGWRLILVLSRVLGIISLIGDI